MIAAGSAEKLVFISRDWALGLQNSVPFTKGAQLRSQRERAAVRQRVHSEAYQG
jgi:hypothetical protein